MKLRWTKSSVRFRISPGELEALQQGRSVGEALRLPGGGWEARIQAGSETTGIGFINGCLQLSLSIADRDRLAAPDAEGVYFQAEGETLLRYYIEKDFPCAHPRAAEAQEPAGETFAPPADFEARKRE